jgi:hypothetical protein
VRAGLAQRDRLGAGREARAGDDGDGGFVCVCCRFRDLAEFGAERVGRRQVLHVVFVEEGVVAPAGAVEVLVGERERPDGVGRVDCSYCGGGDDCAGAEGCECPDVRSVWDAMGGYRVAGAVAGEEDRGACAEGARRNLDGAVWRQDRALFGCLRVEEGVKTRPADHGDGGERGAHGSSLPTPDRLNVARMGLSQVRKPAPAACAVGGKRSTSAGEGPRIQSADLRRRAAGDSCGRREDRSARMYDTRIRQRNKFRAFKTAGRVVPAEAGGRWQTVPWSASGPGEILRQGSRRSGATGDQLLRAIDLSLSPTV